MLMIRRPRLLMPCHPGLVCLLGSLLLSGCSGGGGGTSTGDPGASGGGAGGGAGTGGGANEPALTLQEGDFWTFMWSLEDTDTAQGAGTSHASDAGSYTISLGAPVAVAGLELLTVIIDGDHEGLADNVSVALAPPYLFVGVDDQRLVGSRDGVNLETVFDFGGSSWQGGGWFREWDPTTVLSATVGHLSNDFVDVDGQRAGASSSDGGCEYFPGAGTICPGDDEWNIRIYDHAKGGIGMVGYESRITYTSNGGGFFTSFTTEIDVGLVETSLVATDGWMPTPLAWSQAQPLPSPRTDFGAAALDGKLYVFGGYLGGSTTPTDDVQVYDPIDLTWTQLAPMPFGPRGDCTAEALGGSLFVFCGYDPANPQGGDELHRYDPLTGSWTEESAPPEPLSDVKSAVLPDLYGGMIAYLHGDTDGVRILFFEPGTDTWYNENCPSTPRVSRCGFAGDGGDLFLVGGWRYEFDPWDPWDETDRVRMWNDNLCWSYPPSLGDKRQELTALHLDGYIYAIGGEENSVTERTVERMDTATLGGWEEIQGVLTPRSNPEAVALDGKLYVLGGVGAGGQRLASVEVLDPLNL